MRTRRAFINSVFLLSSGSGLLRADLDAVRAEQKPEKRSQKAVQNADKMLTAARKAYMKGEGDLVSSALTEVRESVELAYKSLDDMGKNPRKNARPYKKAEIGTRTLLRRLDSFRNEMSYLEREQIEGVIVAVREINQKLLHDVMGGGK